MQTQIKAQSEKQPKIHETHIRVRYAETDAMGIVHHSNYIIWFEVGRTELMATRGYTYAEFEKKGYYLVVSEVGARYARPARYGEDIILRTYVSEVKTRAVRFEYEILEAESRQSLVTGFTRHILTDHQGRVRKFPPDMMTLLKEAVTS